MSKKEVPLFSIVRTSFFLALAMFVIGNALENMGLSWLFISKAFSDSYAWADDLSFLIVAFLTIMPITALLEEIVFRYVPFALCKPSSVKAFWSLGILTSAVFAWAHSLNGVLEFSGFPTSHFIVALILWRHVPSGLKTVFAMHYLYNVFIAIFYSLATLI